MAGMDTIVGSGSLMPDDMIPRKYEQTCIYEDPGLIHNYQRNILKKTGTEKPFLESDQTRRRTDSRGFLALRECGKRSRREPWLPDGTFLDHQFLTKDPRSLMPGPDFQKLNDQRWARARFLNFKNDADHSIPEQGIHPENYRRMIREGQHDLKKRLRIFDTSELGWHNGGVGAFTTTSSKSMVEVDQDAPENANFTLENRRSKVTDLSNKEVVGWRSTVDHKFKVASYSKRRSLWLQSKDDYYKNRSSAIIDHDVHYAQHEQRPILRDLALTMANMSRSRTTAMRNARGYKKGKSQELTTRKQRLDMDDVVAMRGKYSKISQSANPHTKINGFMNNKQQMNPTDLIKSKRRTHVNPKIAKQVTMINKTRSKLERDDLRKEIRRTAKDRGVYHERKNTKRQNFEGLDAVANKFRSDYDQDTTEGKTAHNYSASTKIPTKSKMDQTSAEDFGDYSEETHQRKASNLLPGTLTVDHTVEDTEVFEFDPHRIAHKAPLGNKRTASYMRIRSHTQDSMSDLETSHRSGTRQR